LSSDDEWQRLAQSAREGGNGGAQFGDDADDEPNSDDLVDVEQPFLTALGIDGDWTPDRLAPPVDEQRLKAFLRGELSGEQEEEIIGLMARYRCWHHAWQRLKRLEMLGDETS